MTNQDIYKIIKNNKDIPFIKKIISKEEQPLLKVSYEGKYIVCVDSSEKAIKSGNFIPFNDESDATYFIENYKSYWETKSTENMNQEEYEQWRGSPAGRKYIVTIDDGTKYQITVEPK